MASELKIIAAGYSDIGPKDENQDSFNYCHPGDDILRFKGVVGVIADGVSSSEYGGEAARTSVKNFIEDYYSTPDSWTVKKSAQKILVALNSWLFRQGQNESSTMKGLVTTFSSIVFKSTQAYLFHIGDSRIYRLRDGELEQLTRDHMADMGGGRIYLSRALGVDNHLEVDCRGIDLRINDTFLLTTDGVHDFVDHDSMCEIVSEKSSVAERARKIVEKALKNKTPDNVTALIFEVESLPEETEEEVFQKLTKLPFPPDLQPGMIIDGFKILKVIAESARGQVYLAEDTANQTKIVLKTPSVNYEDDPIYLNGFIQEQWVGQRINHPGVMKPYISGRHRTCLYFKTEYIDGQNLQCWIKENSEPSLSKVRPIVEQMTQALRAFHRQDMVHQDLKPDNIMIDTSGRVKIIDFGSTKVAGVTEITSVINPDHPMGTLNYTAPEYMVGEPGTNRSDIFSLGVIVYEMLTGHLPYKEKNIDSFKLRRYSDMKYIPARKWRVDVPEWVDAALKKAVAPNPADRYGLLSEFMYDFKTPKRDINGTDFQPLLKRNPVLVWRGIAVSCFVLWLVTLWWFLLMS